MTAGAGGNSVLRRLSGPVLAQLSLVSQEVQIGDVLQESGQTEQFVYFPTTAVASIVSTMSSGESVEVAMVGRDGMIGLTGVLGFGDSATTSVVQVAGTCLRSTSVALRDVCAVDRDTRATVDRALTAMLVQVAQLAACHRLHPIGARLPRWLLALFDRVDVDVLRLSQQGIADMLGVHRPTVALELQHLHRRGAISYRDRLVTLAHRPLLEAASCECHASMHQEYRASMLASAPPPLAHDGAAAAHVLGAVREIAGRLLITAIRESEAREEAQAASAAKDRLLSIVSHQLKTPLHAILGWCSLSQQTAPTAEVLAKIERNARAQVTLVDDLLHAAQISAGAMMIVPAPTDVVSVVGAALDSVRPLADAKGLTLQFDPPDRMPLIDGDADRLQRALEKVLTNAVQFTDEGPVDVEVSSDIEHVQIRVRDNGCGVAPDLLPRVFDSFCQSEAAQSRNHGVGLGLTIAQALVKLHHGTVQLASEGRGQGTVCTITLPRSLTAIRFPHSPCVVPR